MFSMPIKAVQDRLRAALSRMHNYDPAMRDAGIRAAMEAQWNEVMGKAEAYTQGPDIPEHGGHFSTMSLGNWMTVAEMANIPIVPTRPVGTVDPVMILDIASNGFSDSCSEELRALVSGLQDLSDTEILRFDPAGNGFIKAELASGFARPDGLFLSSDAKGWHRRATGDGEVVFPVLNDERLVSQLIENPEDRQPIWAREIIHPAMLRGGILDENLRPVMDAEGGKTEAYFPCEWRVYVRNSRVEAISNYYPQITRGATPEDLRIAGAMVLEAKARAEAVLAVLKQIGGIPHHPRYELRDGFDPDGGHFSLDFIEIRDDTAPSGRSLVFLEGGPAHLRNPNWGAHPTCFGLSRAPGGVALGLGRITELPK